QQPAKLEIGQVTTAGGKDARAVGGFSMKLDVTGVSDGRNVAIEDACPDQYEQRSVLAAVLLRSPVNVISASGLPSRVTASAATERDFDTVFATLARLQAGGLMAGAHAFFNSRSEQLAAMALRHAVPMITPYREFAEAGGLMSYGHSITEQYRQAGIYVGRII